MTILFVVRVPECIIIPGMVLMRVAKSPLVICISLVERTEMLPGVLKIFSVTLYAETVTSPKCNVVSVRFCEMTLPGNNNKQIMNRSCSDMFLFSRYKSHNFSCRLLYSYINQTITPYNYIPDTADTFKELLAVHHRVSV